DYCAENEDEEYEPPAHQLRSASWPMKRKVASVPRKSCCSSKPTKRGKQLLRWARLPLDLVMTMRTSGTLQRDHST
ncbi:hypothetical protein AMECASPLE_039698, partial [Ameca splendens]